MTVRTLLVGIDGGGTRTRLRLATPEGTVLADGDGGPANIALDAGPARESIRQALDLALSRVGLLGADCRLIAVAGLAGAEATGAVARFNARPAMFARLRIVSDAYTSCVGAHAGADGAMVAAGTGTVGLAIAGGATRRVGGWGFPQGDEGGGAWIGLQAIRLMLRAGDGRIPPTLLSEAVRARLADGGADPMLWAVGARAADFAALVPMVAALARDGDAEARDLLGRAGAEIELLLGALRAAEGFASLPCCVLGGLAPLVLPYLSPATRAGLSAPKGDAIDGAMRLAKRLHETPPA
ncbi:MAG: BadF/BadG/BcrA/BcrD ATPase family protein [Gluconacetobacter sp.]